MALLRPHDPQRSRPHAASAGCSEVYAHIEEHIPQLQRFANSLTRNPDAADDLLQNCLERALAKSSLYRPGTNLRAWLCTILRNQFTSDRRREQGREATIDPEHAAGVLRASADAEARVRAARVRAALTRLPCEQRQLIELVAFDGCSYDEVADRLGLRPGTVKSRISRSRSRLRDLFERE